MSEVEQTMRDIIAKRLAQIEQEEQVRIIYACESGKEGVGVSFPRQ